MNCTVCRNTPTRQINLYVEGSEGIALCSNCELNLVDVIKTWKRIWAQGKKTGWFSHQLKLNLEDK